MSSRSVWKLLSLAFVFTAIVLSMTLVRARTIERNTRSVQGLSETGRFLPDELVESIAARALAQAEPTARPQPQPQPSTSGAGPSGASSFAPEPKAVEPPVKTTDLTAEFLLSHVPAEQMRAILEKVFAVEVETQAMRFLVAPTKREGVEALVYSGPAPWKEKVENAVVAFDVAPVDGGSGTVNNILRLKHARAQNAVEILKLAFTDPSLVLVNEEPSNSIVVRVPKKSMAAVRRAIEFLDQMAEAKPPATIRVLSLQNAPAPDLFISLQQAEEQLKLRVSFDERSNSLIAIGSEDQVLAYEALVQRLDQPRDQADAAPVPYERQVARIKVIPVQNVRAVSLAATVKPLEESLKLRVSIDQRTNSLIAIGGADQLSILESLVLRLDEPAAAHAGFLENPVSSSADTTPVEPRDPTMTGQPGSAIRVLRPRHLPAADVIGSLQHVEQHFHLRVSAEPQSNSLIAVGPEDQLRAFEELVSNLDREAGEAHKELLKARSTDAAGDDLSAAITMHKNLQAGKNYFELKQIFQNQNLDLTRRVEDLRQAQDQADEFRIGELTSHLRDTVSKLFDARQRLQRSELERLRERLEKLEQSIESREAKREQIIDRRVEELLHPEQAWDTEPVRP